MKILHVIASIQPLPHATRIILGLQDHGLEQSVFVPRQSEHILGLQKAGVKLWSYPFCTPRLVQKIKLSYAFWRIKPDIIHCWTADGAALAAQAGQGGSVLTGWFGTSVDLEKFHSCPHLVSASRPATKRAPKDSPARKIHFISKPPDILAQAPIDRATLATARSAKVLLIFVRSLPGRDIELLLEVLKSSPQWVAWFVGTGVWRHELEMLARQHGIIDRVRFLKRRQDHAALLRAADVCVVPPGNDPFGAVMLEAWAAGTPVIVCGDAAGQVEDGVNGLVVPVGDGENLGKALARVIEDDGLRRSLISRSYAAYIKDYTQDTVLRQWVAFFKAARAA